MCKECGNALSEQGEKLIRDSSSQSLQDSLVDVLARRLAKEDPAEDVEEIEDMVENKSIVELLQEVS